MLSELKRTFHNRAGRRDEPFRFLLRPKHLPVQSCQFRLVIVRVHRAGTARHEQLNNSLHLWHMLLSGIGISRQHLSQGEARKTTTGTRKEFTAQK